MARTQSSNLRPAASRFVGRARELDQLQTLYDEGQRLVTVFGPAGTGKTRLAEALGRAAVDKLSLSGVWLCELAETRDLDGMCSVVGHVLGVPPQPSESPEDQVIRLGRALAARGPLLLILDNFEQLADLAADTVAIWLREAPDLRLLVTSREQLRIRSEVRFELLPLSLPSEDPGSTDVASEAVDLFVDRVRALDPNFAVDARNRALVVALVRRLEGIPLAIELAASRVELLGLQGLLDNLDKRLDVLVDKMRDGSGRHTTLRAAIDSSWSLLDEAERHCLSACSVFKGGFSPAAAGEIVGPSVAEALPRLQSLRDKSLLRKLERDDRPGQPRFGLFEAIREFAAEKLDASDERPAVEERHAAYFMSAGESWAEKIIGSQAADALDRLTDNHDNLLAVHRWALARRDGDAGEAAIRCALILDAVAAVRRPFASHLAMLEETLAAARVDDLPADLWVRALRARARARRLAGRGTAAQRDLDAALAAATDLDDDRLRAGVLADLAMGHHQQRQTGTARAVYERALDHARKAEDAHLEGRILGNLAALLHDRRRFDDALAQYRDALALLREVGDQRLEAIHVANLGILEQERGEMSRARGHYDAALELLVELGDQRLEAIVVGNLGSLEHEEGQLQKARTCHERALSILRSVGDRHSEALCLGRLARGHAAADYLDDARACLSAAERILGRHEDPLAAEAIRIDRGFVDAAQARQCARDSDTDTAATHVAAAQARIAHATEGAGEEPSWADRSDDIRTAVRMLQHDLARSVAPSTATGQTIEAPRAALTVGEEGRWFELPDGERQDLRRRRAIRLILARLVANHRDDPGAGLPLDALQEAGWPGERMVASAGANRVYVALTTLRKLGLRQYLLSQDDGYLLDPAMPVVHSADE